MPTRYIPAVRGYYSTPDGRLVSMPFNSSTASAWYNLDVLEKAGVDPAHAAGDLAGGGSRHAHRCDRQTRRRSV